MWWKKKLARDKSLKTMTKHDLYGFLNTAGYTLVDLAQSVNSCPFHNREYAEDWAYLFQRLGANVTMHKCGSEGAFCVEFLHRPQQFIQDLALTLAQCLLPWASDYSAFIKKEERDGKPLPYVYLVTFPEELVELFPSYKFPSASTLIVAKEGRPWTFETDIKNLVKKYTPKDLKPLLRSLSAEENRRKSSRDKKLSSSTLRNCQKLNDVCTYKPLTSDDWCDVSRANIERFENRCFDLEELLAHFEAGLDAQKYGNPFPKPPSDPFTRVVFSSDELQDIRKSQARAKLVTTYDKTSRFVDLHIKGTLPLPTTTEWTTEERLFVISKLGLKPKRGSS